MTYCKKPTEYNNVSDHTWLKVLSNPRKVAPTHNPSLIVRKCKTTGQSQIRKLARSRWNPKLEKTHQNESIKIRMILATKAPSLEPFLKTPMILATRSHPEAAALQYRNVCSSFLPMNPGGLASRLIRETQGGVTEITTGMVTKFRF